MISCSPAYKAAIVPNRFELGLGFVTKYVQAGGYFRSTIPRFPRAENVHSGKGLVSLRIGVILARDFQALDLGLQGGAFQPEPAGSAVRSGDHPSGFPEHANDVLALGRPALAGTAEENQD